MLATGGWFAAMGFQKVRHYYAYKNAMIVEDYVRLHPELFVKEGECLLTKQQNE